MAIQRVALQDYGAERVAGTLDFLRWAVVEERLKVADAVEMLRALDVGKGLLKRIERAGRTAEDVLRGRG